MDLMSQHIALNDILNDILTLVGGKWGGGDVGTKWYLFILLFQMIIVMVTADENVGSSSVEIDRHACCQGLEIGADDGICRVAGMATAVATIEWSARVKARRSCCAYARQGAQETANSAVAAGWDAGAGR